MDTSSDGNLGAETLTGAPPSPQEVKVRTMASDLASMAASGGGLPQFQNVKIVGVSAVPRDVQETTRKTSLWVALLSIVAVLVVIVAGYFAYKVYQKAVSPPPVTGTAVGQ